MPREDKKGKPIFTALVSCATMPESHGDCSIRIILQSGTPPREEWAKCRKDTVSGVLITRPCVGVGTDRVQIGEWISVLQLSHNVIRTMDNDQRKHQGPSKALA